MGTKIHKGLWLECKVCPHTPEELEQKKREKRERPSPRRKRTDAATLDVAVRRQVSQELGGPDAEPSKDEKFQVLQKYGIAAARIDRKVTKPTWMTEEAWNEKKSQFYKATAGLVPKEQFKRTQSSRFNSRVPNRGNRPQHQHQHPDSRRKNSQNFHRNFDRTRTGNTPR